MSAGWNSDLPKFRATAAGEIQGSLEAFVLGASPQQRAAWKEEIPLLQREADELLAARREAHGYGAILEYLLPYDERRPDVVVLAEGAIVVLELKGKLVPTRADLDQAAAYARDLAAYHRECHERPVHAVVVPTRSRGLDARPSGVRVTSPDRLDGVVAEIAARTRGTGPSLKEFLSGDAYCPLPTLVQAARELFLKREIRPIWKARAATDPAVDTIARIAHEAAATKSRHLILVTGIPGAGKTLVGMRAVHARHLDDLAVPRASGRSTVPGLYLTGNGPLSEVLQYELRKAGGAGRTFVRHIKSYLDRYVPHPERIPPEHLLVFDEAQRAFSADMVADKHPAWPAEILASEPELFVRLCDRMPEWSVLVGLIGGGQEIHLGEEGGLAPWRRALEQSQAGWTVHAPAGLESVFQGAAAATHWRPELNLTTELRFHLAAGLHDLVQDVLGGAAPAQASQVAERARRLFRGAKHAPQLYLTRDLDAAKQYLHDRYAEYREARYGLLASSRDRDLPRFGVPNDYMATKNVNKGAWFSEGAEDARSCRHLTACMTEFGCQGLEVEMALVAWGTDLMREAGHWSIRRARRYGHRGRTRAVDPLQMRLNAYRVLLTRGRDGAVVFVPPLRELDETHAHLAACGFDPLL